MAEFIEGKEQAVNEGDPIIFENKTGSAFDVSVGVVFHESGIYEVSIAENRTVVSKVMERPPAQPESKRGKWKGAYLDHESMGVRPKVLYCSECNQCIAYPTNFCPNCGADMRGEQDG